MKSRCHDCNGKRKVLGLGGMIKDCLTCNRTGWIDDVSYLENVCAADLLPKVDKRSREYREMKKQQEA